MGRLAEMQRKLLEQMMEPEAMGATNANLVWSDEKVCRNFLCGTCPHVLFTNTKIDLRPCELVLYCRLWKWLAPECPSNIHTHRRRGYDGQRNTLPGRADCIGPIGIVRMQHVHPSLAVITIFLPHLSRKRHGDVPEVGALRA